MIGQTFLLNSVIDMSKAKKTKGNGGVFISCDRDSVSPPRNRKDTLSDVAHIT